MRLVDDLLDVSRIARGKVELRRGPVDIATAVALAVEATTPLVAERGHALVVDVPPDLSIDVDPDRITQVIVNLVTNAARYTPRPGRIVIAATRQGDEVRVSVRDSGPGVPDAVMPHLFEPFVQGERSVDRAEGGLGLGLAIVKNLVEQHGGRVDAANPPGGGAELAVWLPSAPRKRPSTPAPGVGREASGRRALRVLVVDDNVDAAEMLGELLRVFGHDPIVVHDATQALAAALPVPDLAFLDIGLPDIDGYELARRLRAFPASRRRRSSRSPATARPAIARAATRRGSPITSSSPVDIAKLRALLDAVASGERLRER